MKKQEAISIAEERSNLVLEFIEQILTVGKNISGLIEFYSVKLEEGMSCGMHIKVDQTGYEQYYNLGIPSKNIISVYETIFQNIIKAYLFCYELYYTKDKVGICLWHSYLNNTVNIEFLIMNSSLEKWRDEIVAVIDDKKEEKAC